MKKAMAKPFVPLWALGGILAALLSVPPSGVAQHQVGQAGRRGRGGGGTQPKVWTEDFNDSIEEVESRGWAREHYGSSGEFGVPGRTLYHVGYFDKAHAELVPDENDAGNKYLRLKLTQVNGEVDGNQNGVISTGALLYSLAKYGYGTYEWRMRMSSTATTPHGKGTPESGNVSAGFIYADNSATEIDVEFGGWVIQNEDPSDDDSVYMGNWNNRDPSTDPAENESTFHVISVPGASSEFHTYKFEWKKNSITFYVDGVPQVVHRTDVPNALAHFMINHWGTNGGFGGAAIIGLDRYFYVDWVRYTPAN